MKRINYTVFVFAVILLSSFCLADTQGTLNLAEQVKELQIENIELRNQLREERGRSVRKEQENQAKISKLRADIMTLDGSLRRNEQLVEIYKAYGKEILELERELTEYRSKEEAWLRSVQKGDLIRSDRSVDVSEYEKLVESNISLRSQIDALIKTNNKIKEDFDNVINNCNITKTALENNLQSVREREELLKNELNKLKTTNELQNNTKIQMLEKDVIRLNNEKKTLTDDLARVRSLLDTESKKWDVLVNDLVELRKAYNDYRSSTDRLLRAQEEKIRLLEAN